MTSNRTVQDLFVQEYGKNIKKWIVSAVTSGENVAKIGALYKKVVAMSAERVHLDAEYFCALTTHNGAPMMDITPILVTTHLDEVTAMHLRFGLYCPYLAAPPQAVVTAFNPTEFVSALATKED